MPDMPPLSENKILALIDEIEAMRRGGSKEDQKPHKLLMLLAVLDLFDQKLLNQNQIYFDQQLEWNFEKYFRYFARSDDWCQPGPPFFHLRTASFWNHKVKSGREVAYSKLSTSGGGKKRIQENIEYAYFDELTFSLLSNKSYRDQLRSYLFNSLGNINLNSTERIPTVFHESFTLSRPSISQILNAIYSSPQSIDFKSKERREEYFREHTQLGKNYVKSMPEYAKGAGLISFDYQPTHFGQIVREYDPGLDQSTTLWLMHYHLSAPHGPGPLFWHTITSSRFRVGDEFSQEDIESDIFDIYSVDKGKPLSPGSATSTANAFLETYVKSDGLGRLGLLEEVGDNYYRVQDVDTPPVWVIAVAILDYWQSRFPTQVTVNLGDLTNESGLANIFMISRSRLNFVLEEMREAGIVELFRVAPPYQVALLDSRLEPIFRRMYSHE